MAATSIEWTDHSINPIRARILIQAEPEPQYAIGHHCEKISPGCANCYASSLQKRFNMPAFKGVGAGDSGTESFLDESKLQEVLRRKKPTRYFWCDMTDLFGDWVPDEWLVKCFATMALTPWHTHQVLTKRPERARRFLRAPNVEDCVDHMAFHLTHDACMGGNYDAMPDAWPLLNVWLGVSVEDQQRADERIPLLLQTPAAVRFLSCEPLLEEVDLNNVSAERLQGVNAGWLCPLMPTAVSPALSWVIVGGESGPNARPCNLAWIRSLVKQCKVADAPVFVKQLGSRPYVEGTPSERFNWPCDFEADQGGNWLTLKDRKGGDMSEFPPDLQVREFPREANP